MVKAGDSIDPDHEKTPHTTKNLDDWLFEVKQRVSAIEGELKQVKSDNLKKDAVILALSTRLEKLENGQTSSLPSSTSTTPLYSQFASSLNKPGSPVNIAVIQALTTNAKVAAVKANGRFSSEFRPPRSTTNKLKKKQMMLM
jgi:hypothetical protein